MLPLVSARKSTVQVTAQQDRLDRASISERLSTQTESDAVLTPLDLGRSRSFRKKGPESHIAKPELEGKGSLNIDVKAPRASGIVARRSNYYRTTSGSVSNQVAQFSDGSSNINAVTNRQSEAGVPLKPSRTTGPVGHERTVSVTKPARAESKLQRHGRSSSKQLSASHTPSLNLLPPRQDQRPAFSTLQQHFSPKKSNKAPTASFFAPVSSKQELDGKSLSEIARLQMELTQLYLLHRNSTATQAQWEKSAERSLQRRFERLSRQHVELKEIACESQALINQSALLLWCRQSSDAEIAEKLQLLSRCILDIGSMLNSESKLEDALRLFEAWFDRVSRIQNSRRCLDHAVGLSLDFVESIGDGWTAEVDRLNKRLSSLSRELDSLGEVRKESSVSRVLVMLKSIVSNLLVELELIRSIEHEVMTQETSWVQDMIEGLTKEVDKDLTAMATSHRGAWHDKERPC